MLKEFKDKDPLKAENTELVQKIKEVRRGLNLNI